MPKIKLSDRWLKAITPPTAGRADYHDIRVPGLTLRVTDRGKLSWSVVYRLPGDRRKRRFTLGAYPAVTLAEARQVAHGTILEASRGNDPASEKQSARQAPTFEALSAEYKEKHGSQKRSGPEDARMIDKDLLPAWGRRKAHEIKRRDVIHLLDGIKERGAPIQANRTLALVRKIYNWGISRDLVDFNPCSQVKAPGKEHRRDRVLTAEEIARFWRGLDAIAMSNPIRLALKLILVTAQRAGEVIGAEWSEIELTSQWWTIHSAKAKNGLAHRVPLSACALELLTALKACTGEDSSFLFPSPRGNQPVDETALSHALRRNRELLGIDHFTPHDLRRTAASHMTGSGISRLVVSKILNHAERGVTAVYDRHSYDIEKRQALDTWADHLQHIFDADKKEELPSEMAVAV